MEVITVHIRMLSTLISRAENDTIAIPGKEVSIIARWLFEEVEFLPDAAAALISYNQKFGGSPMDLKMSVADATDLVAELKQIKMEAEQGLPEWRKTLNIPLDWKYEDNREVLRGYVERALLLLKETHK